MDNTLLMEKTMGRCTSQILIIEDSATLAKLAMKSLERVGYLPCHAPDGATALEHIAQNPPDLILLDIYLPDMTGWQILDYARAHHMLAASTAVIVMTTQDDATNRTVGKMHQVSHYLIKPVSPDDLITVVTGVLGMGVA